MLAANATATRCFGRDPRPLIPHGRPPRAGDVMGVDLALLDGDAAAVVAWFVDGRAVDPGDEETTRKHSLGDLEMVVPHLSEAGRTYFGPLLEMVRAVDSAKQARSSTKPD